ncbi:leucine-rich repeat protein [Trypanosoma rangeli]|uniref:Leucine-rich repeat protein n=1 Tax=Trypanosoma rangeli TaxID=5698 RepID=A0A422NRS7_TRYRA|nr:leucine-rich repeat protein [Trypanosoma rangeli]RNF08192.1 leucine-rich repeat protein [Trypanosoma rangeli]|eukprot:RNF08192.1 leucine-rich repeat protein [Trypanosoma rangeli]
MTDAEERFLDAVQQAYDNKALTLYFSYQEDFDAIPAAIKALRETLEVLHVDNNYSLTALPPAIGDLGRLRWLNASYCRLMSLPQELGRLSHLERLYLSNNLLQSVPVEMWQLKSLQELRLDNNKLRVLPGGILFLLRLESLTLENNPLFVPEDVAGAAPSTLVSPLSSVDCSNCCVRVRNYEVLITFHNVAALRSVPFMHCLCSPVCRRHLEVRLAEYDASHSSPNAASSPS